MKPKPKRKPKPPRKQGAKQGPPSKPQLEPESVEQPYPKPPDLKTLPLHERLDLLLVRYPKAKKYGRLEPGVSEEMLKVRRECLKVALGVGEWRRKPVDLEAVHHELDWATTEELRAEILEEIAERYREWHGKTKELAKHLMGKKPEKLQRMLERSGLHLIGDQVSRLLTPPRPKRSVGKPKKPRTQARKNLIKLVGEEAAGLFLQATGLAPPPP